MDRFLNQIICGDNVEVMRQMPDKCVDLTVTSPPYDNLRTYNGFSFDFENVAKELYRITKDGGVVVWVVADATVNGSETGTSFRQALYFMDCGFNLHDTMIYAKNNPVPQFKSKRYTNAFEYMFILSKGTPNTCNYIMEDSKTAGTSKSRIRKSASSLQSADKSKDEVTITKEKKIKNNIWYYNVGVNQSSKDKIAFEHPAIFPEKLAEDHIISWSNPGDIVLDPFLGSGTTAKMALLNNRNFIGFEISEEYCKIAEKRISETTSKFSSLKGRR